MLGLYATTPDGEVDTSKGLYRNLFPSKEHKEQIASKYNVKADLITETRSAPNIIKETLYESTLYTLEV